jgi:2-polyprenyl-3-methyl-5-hydroxy-6-metoxy-1,4-benzoquinol methylase
MSTIFEQALGLRMMWGGFWTSRILMTANNYRIFDHLQPPRTAAELAAELGTDPRATTVILDALTALKLVRKNRGRYRNTPLAARFLVSGTPHYQGDILRHADSLWKSWSQLDTVLATGRPAAAPHDHPAFIKGMHNIASLIAPEVIRAIGLKGVSKALDLGGGPGTYAMEMAKRGARVTLFDLPDTIAIARKVVKEAMASGVSFKAGDVLTDSLGSGYDLVLVSQFIHAFSPEETALILTKSCAALKPGGRIAVQEFPLDESHTAPTQGALFSVNMLVQTPGGRCYPAAEIVDLLKRAGCSKCSVGQVAGNALVMGHKASP